MKIPGKAFWKKRDSRFPVPCRDWENFHPSEIFSSAMSAQDLHSFGMIEGIIQEGSSNAQLMRNVARTLRDQLAELSAEPSIEVMLEKRYEKFRKIGVFRTINQDQNEGV